MYAHPRIPEYESLWGGRLASLGHTWGMQLNLSPKQKAQIRLYHIWKQRTLHQLIALLRTNQAYKFSVLSSDHTFYVCIYLLIHNAMSIS